MIATSKRLILLHPISHTKMAADSQLACGFREHGSGVSAPFLFAGHRYSSNRLIGIQNRVSVTMRLGASK
jgi:hypothetical protein